MNWATDMLNVAGQGELVRDQRQPPGRALPLRAVAACLPANSRIGEEATRGADEGGTGQDQLARGELA